MTKSRLIGALCVSFCLMTMFVTSLHAIGITGQGTWKNTLLARDLDGNLSTAEAYYDTELSITWLANADVGAGSVFDDGSSTTDGLMTWASANEWAAALSFTGANDWRLPTVNDIGSPGCIEPWLPSGSDCGYNVDTSTGEMAYMFYTTLGDKAFCDSSGFCPQAGYGLSNTGPFSNIWSSDYWYATEYALNTDFAWVFAFSGGSQLANPKHNDGYHAWAVHDGDVGAAIVPVPAAVWLFGSGLLGLIGLSIFNKNA